MPNTENTVITTHDLYLAAFLLYEEFTYLGLSWDGGKGEFQFADHVEMEAAQLDFMNAKASVEDLQAYLSCVYRLKTDLQNSRPRELKRGR